MAETAPSLEPKKSAPRLAFVSLITGILCVLGGSLLVIPALLAIVSGHIARSQCKKREIKTGSNAALAGLIMGYGSSAIALLFGMFILFAMPALKQLRASDLEAQKDDIRQNLGVLDSAALLYMRENRTTSVGFDEIVGKGKLLSNFYEIPGTTYPKSFSVENHTSTGYNDKGEPVTYTRDLNDEDLLFIQSLQTKTPIIEKTPPIETVAEAPQQPADVDPLKEVAAAKKTPVIRRITDLASSMLGTQKTSKEAPEPQSGAFAEKEADAFSINSNPPRFVSPGRSLIYQIDAKTSSQPITYELASGPKGTALTQEGRLYWKAPSSSSKKEVNFVVKVTNAEGKSIFHKVDLRIGKPNTEEISENFANLDPVAPPETTPYEELSFTNDANDKIYLILEERANRILAESQIVSTNKNGTYRIQLPNGRMVRNGTVIPVLVDEGVSIKMTIDEIASTGFVASSQGRRIEIEIGENSIQAN